MLRWSQNPNPHVPCTAVDVINITFDAVRLKVRCGCDLSTALPKEICERTYQITN